MPVKYQIEAVGISIHTTTQVVTHLVCPAIRRTDISIHTTTQVVTRHPCEILHHIAISIHTTTQVVTAIWLAFLSCSIQFQSTPPRRW